MRFRLEDALAAKAQGGDEYALERLRRMVSGQIEAVVRHNRKALEFGDALSIANIAFLACVEAFDPSRGCGFRTYLQLRISSRLMDANKAERRLRARTLPYHDNQLSEVADERVQEPSPFRLDVEPQDRQILTMWNDGCTLREIGAEIGVSHEFVRRRLIALQRVLQLQMTDVPPPPEDLPEDA